jgi:hypothetical protein
MIEYPAKKGWKKEKKGRLTPIPFKTSFHFHMLVNNKEKVKSKIKNPSHHLKTEKEIFIFSQPMNLITQIKRIIPIKREIKDKKNLLMIFPLYHA